jgi:hypothetical protein
MVPGKGTARSQMHTYTKAAARAIISRATAAVNVEPKLGPNHTNNNITLVTSLGLHLLYPDSRVVSGDAIIDTHIKRQLSRECALAICCYIPEMCGQLFPSLGILSGPV